MWNRVVVVVGMGIGRVLRLPCMITKQLSPVVVRGAVHRSRAAPTALAPATGEHIPTTGHSSEMSINDHLFKTRAIYYFIFGASLFFYFIF